MAAADEVSRSIVQLLLKEPYFGHLLGCVSREINNSTPTAAVGLRGTRPVLIVNEDFFMNTLKKSPERVAVIKHEALHLLFKHLLRIDKKKYDPLLFNLAADLVVNQFIKSPWKLPDSAVTLESFPDLNLLADQTLQWYYDKLKTCEQSDDGGDCGGSGPGGSAPKSKEAIDRMRAAMRGWHSDHSQWGKYNGENDSEDGLSRAAETEIDRIVSQAKDRAGPQAWGSLPGAIRDLITAILERRKPKVDWRRTLRIFSASSSRTKIKSTINRVSKRFGTNPGIKIKRFQHMAVVIDTSGSISDHDLSAFFAEIHGMWQRGAQVTVIECDAAIHNTWEYRGKLPAGVGGRGGTCFDPAFQWMREHHGAAPFDGCIFLTDGYAPQPTVKPPCKLIWCVLPGGSVGEHLVWGSVLQLPAEATEK